VLRHNKPPEMGHTVNGALPLDSRPVYARIRRIIYRGDDDLAGVRPCEIGFLFWLR
jgi:hypothetical protein